MQQFFDTIVQLFETVCRHTGFRYSELNILVYCLLLPAAWCSIVWYRIRRLGWLVLTWFVLTACYVFEKQQHAQFSISFYKKNIAALEYSGAGTGMGYVGISLVVGVLFPLLISLALVFLPKKVIPLVYLIFLVVNLIYYGWVLRNF